MASYQPSYQPCFRGILRYDRRKCLVVFVLLVPCFSFTEYLGLVLYIDEETARTGLVYSKKRLLAIFFQAQHVSV